MRQSEIKYLDETIEAHVRRFFKEEAVVAFESIKLHWCSMDEASQPYMSGIYIPTDIANTSMPDNAWKVQFGNAELTFWNLLPPPSTEWILSNSSAPFWYVHTSGAIMPAWNLARTLFELLTLKEERNDQFRDMHGRSVGVRSDREPAGLLEAPIFNDSVAALVAACIGLKRIGAPDTSLDSRFLEPPVIVLSHDLDQLRGNDFWTQSARLIRAFNPRNFIGPSFRIIGYTMANFIFPKRYYFDNIAGMIEIERMMGFTSSFYFLNGNGGRYGARSGSKSIPLVAANLPQGWDLGIHYNYNTHLNQSAFVAQIKDLEMLIGCRVVAGRSHYLRFDPIHSWNFYVTMGIKVDESLGYPDRIGYRSGIAGPFQPYDPETGEAMPLVEMPLVIMESALVGQYPLDPASAFERHLSHIAKVGGAISVLFHPGQFHNPEHRETLGLYRRLLGIAKSYGARSVNACNL